MQGKQITSRNEENIRKRYNTKYQSVLHTQTNITLYSAIPDRVPHAEQYSTKYWSALHMRISITQNTQDNSTRGKIQHKILERVPHAKKPTQNTRAHSTQRNI